MATRRAHGALLLEVLRLATLMAAAVCVTTSCGRPASPESERTDETVPNSTGDSPEIGSADPWQRAAAAIRYLPLDSFPDVPDWAQRQFAQAGCIVAQSFHPETPHNVVSGEFARRGQVDWAALCRQGDSTQIIVAWGGEATCPSPIAVAPVDDYLQGIGDGRIGYSRALDAISNERIQRLAAEFDGPAPPSTDHDGINDIFIEKVSAVHFCHGGRWHLLAGID